MSEGRKWSQDPDRVLFCEQRARALPPALPGGGAVLGSVGGDVCACAFGDAGGEVLARALVIYLNRSRGSSESRTR